MKRCDGFVTPKNVVFCARMYIFQMYPLLDDLGKNEK